MRFLLKTVVPATALLLALPVCASTKHHKKSTKASSHHTAAAGMTPERATQIQTALIQQGYLTGDPSGHWDSASIAAMQKLQADNGWQTKYTPDSRALIKLGLAGAPDGGGDALAANGAAQ